MTGGRPFNFFQDHSARYLEMALSCEKRERIERPDGCGRRTGDCGDTVEFFIRTAGDRITAAAFDTDGCMDTHACANAVAHLVEGKTLAQAWKITPEVIETYLETLAEDHRHCAELAVGALYLALSNARETTRRPWKKLYRQH
jgi:nitrogen fixation NifU-like protein